MSGLTRIAVETVTHTWQGRSGEHIALRDVSLSVARGEFVRISGPSGAGKTTLLTILGGLTRPTEGRVFLGDEYAWALSETDLAALRGQALAFVFQQADMVSSLSVLDNVALPLTLRGCPSGGTRDRALAALERLGLGSRARALPGELSGGERRRIALARAFAADPSFVLADEPTGDLDPASAAGVVDALLALQADGCGIVVVTHDSALAVPGMRHLNLVEGRISDG